MNNEDEIKELLNDDGELLAVYNDGSTWTFDTLTRQVVEFIDNLQQENKQLKDGLHKILDLNKRAINCGSQKITIKYLLKQYDLIYETLGELQPGLMKGEKE